MAGIIPPHTHQNPAEFIETDFNLTLRGINLHPDALYNQTNWEFNT